ncbi:hypothetical protein M1O52_05505 [Dehalococcoidia bacterium]|nr:hypothetical protein [Dehalococcoidia bacterium]
MGSGLDFGQDVLIIQKLYRLCLAAMFPHEREEPNTTLTDYKNPPG